MTTNPAPPNPEIGFSKGKSRFATTQWETVLNAGDATHADSEQALAALCRDYWYPLYAHVRRCGNGPEDAEDLTQAFFEKLLEKEWLKSANPNRGRFRTFLLTALNNFLANEWDKRQTQKRGGGREQVPFDTAVGESRYEQELQTVMLPETEFNRRWALALLERSLSALEIEYASDGKRAQFEQLKETLEDGQSATPYSTLARKLGMSEGAVRVAAHRLRQRFKELLRLEIRRTVSAVDEVESELRDLFIALES